MGYALKFLSPGPRNDVTDHLAVRTEEKFGTDDTDITEESALLLNYDDESPELNQQVCTTETKGACVHRGDLPFKVR